MNQYMSVTFFLALWSNVHPNCTSWQWLISHIQLVRDMLSDTFVKCYSQELSVDEAMVRYKGYIGGKVVMPKKCCSCSCSGYLCTFQVYHGRPTDLSNSRKTAEKGLAKRDLVGPFVGLNHVVYFTGPPDLVQWKNGPGPVLSVDHWTRYSAVYQCSTGPGPVLSPDHRTWSSAVSGPPDLAQCFHWTTGPGSVRSVDHRTSFHWATRPGPVRPPDLIK